MNAKTFKMPFAGIAPISGIDLLYGEHGDFSAVISLSNPVLQYSADEKAYQAYHSLLLNIVKLLGEGHMIHKQDVFARKTFTAKPSGEYLQQAYNEHFSGREYTQLSTYLTLSKKVDRGRFYVHDERAASDFTRSVTKVMDLLNGAGLYASLLNEKQINALLARHLLMDFSAEVIPKDNFSVGDGRIDIGQRSVRCISLVDVEQIDLPSYLSGYKLYSDGKAMRSFPMDNLSFLHQVPHYECMVYNQVISVPAQRATVSKLELKSKRHSGIPDPANKMCVEDIAALMAEVARENQLLVHAHYSITVCCKSDKLDFSANFIEASLFNCGIIPSRNSYNQLELFRDLLPGNAVSLSGYDLFLAPSSAAICLMFKESLAKSEKSGFLVRFTDRQGIPVAIDPADLPMQSGRIANRSKFVLGGSGSGKSFFMNSLIEQYLLYNMDIVIVDTGHSYSGLCAYYNGRYLTYSEQQPITMNPFAFQREEYNIEKRDFLKTLIFLLLLGPDGEISPIEDTVISGVISGFYGDYFSSDTSIIKPELNFDGFYQYSLVRIAEICEQDKISFDIDAYRFVLKKFCRGGEFGEILNLEADRSLLEERLVVFEIDAIRDHKVLFPIVTLIIMDVFLQKMRLRHSQRKAIILEEAWKAVASKLMASYLVYMYKTVRKFYGEAIVVTQELGDILGNPVVKDSIIANSDTVCLLDQTKFRDNYEKIASLLSLDQREQQKIFTINQLDNKDGRARFKEVYIKRGATGEVYGVEVSLRQYMTFSTEKPEKTALESFIRSYGSFQTGLDAFISAFERSELSLSEFINAVNLKSNST